ncbi:hypothetical protein HUJ05_005177, partial [Dendroctonus ponderosae]
TGNGQRGRGKRSQAEGEKNIRSNLVYLCVLQRPTLLADQKVTQLETELDKIKWNIEGLSEVRRREESQITLKTGHIFHYRGEEETSNIGVGMIVHKKPLYQIIANLIEMKRVFTLTSTSSEKDLDAFHKTINDELEENTNYHTLLISNLNTKLGRKKDEAETSLGTHGFDERNERGSTPQLLPRTLSLFNNYFFAKRLQRKWTWISSDGNTKNEIDCIITNRKEKVHDVAVLNRLFIGSDHRMIRTKVSKIGSSRCNKTNNNLEVELVDIKRSEAEEAHQQDGPMILNASIQIECKQHNTDTCRSSHERPNS